MRKGAGPVQAEAHGAPAEVSGEAPCLSAPRCAAGPGRPSRYEMSCAAVQKHVAVLERAGLIQKRANGREQLVSTNHARLQRAGELLEYFESIWRQRMAQPDDVLLPKGK